MPGIKDRAAIAGVGCTKFGETWEKDQEDLLVEAVYAALDDAGITPQDIEAAWVGVLYHFTGISGGTFAEPMKLFGKPVTRVENFCASGMDAFRNACFAVAAGVYDIVVACGVEKLMDQGSSGLPMEGGHPVMSGVSAPGLFALAPSGCPPMSGGSAAIVITRPEIAKEMKHKDDYVLVKANALAVDSTFPMYRPGYDWLGLPAPTKAASP